MQTLHENAETGIDIYSTYRQVEMITAGTSGQFDSFLAASGWLISMVNHGPWDYKLPQNKSNLRVPDIYGKDFYKYLGMDPNDANKQNWANWVYFEGEIWGADQIGNMNLAYVGARMGLPEWVYANFTTKDDIRDINALDKGMELAREGTW
jgi:hypothetical protein